MNARPQPKSVRRIVRLDQDASGGYTPVTVYRRPKSKKKKSSLLLRPFETMVRRMSDATATSASSYGDRHRASNRKKRDGWIRDLNKNIFKARRRGNKRLKLKRVGLA